MSWDWDYPNIQELIAQRELQHQEATMSGNVGPYTMPFAGVFRAKVPERINCSGDEECSIDFDTWHRMYGTR